MLCAGADKTLHADLFEKAKPLCLNVQFYATASSEIYGEFTLCVLHITYHNRGLCKDVQYAFFVNNFKSNML